MGRNEMDIGGIMRESRISVIGLGHLGQPMAYLYAGNEYKVIGVDKREALIHALKDGGDPIYEPGLSELKELNKHNVELTTNTYDAVMRTDITFVIVPTPSQKNGEFSNRYVITALKEIGKALKKKIGYHLVVITSTVMPGSCIEVFIPLLEKLSKKKCGEEFGFCYNPEFIALGSVIKDLQYPDALLIGESDSIAGDKLELFLKSVCMNNPAIHRMDFYNAELCKISLNTFLTTKISLANSYAELCEKIPNGNVDVVTNFLGSDSRIGRKFLKGGLGYSGSCVKPETMIQTSNGLKRIDMISVGDTVLSHDGYLHNVTKVFKNEYHGKLIKITPWGHTNSSIVTTPDHPIWGAKRISKLKKKYYGITIKNRINYMIGHTEIGRAHV
jgi:UDPglucose 6-dehydrogenase